jgi:hypothetical protein
MIYIAAFIIALFVTLLFIPGYRQNNVSMLPLLFLFFILLLGGIAAQFWIVPFGPVYYGVSWFPVLSVILFLTLLLSAPSPYERRRAVRTEETAPAAAAGSIFIWLLFILLVTAVFIGLYQRPVL